MSIEESLQDVTIRRQQLEAHILRSDAYLKRVDRDLKRQVSMLYLAIALLLVFQGLFSFHAVSQLPISCVTLASITSVLAIANCFLLIQTKTWLRRLNEAWLAPQEKSALEALNLQRHEILARIPRTNDGSANAELN